MRMVVSFGSSTRQKYLMSARIDTQDAAQPVAAYSQAVQAGNLVFVSGQIPLVKDTGALISHSMEEATTQCIRNAEAILVAAGLSLSHVVKASVFLTTMDDYSAMDAAYREAMPQPFPAREAVAVQALPKGARVEISMIASLG
jgi:2-iminobutanoate/2-iminopropanoate deaminase